MEKRPDDLSDADPRELRRAARACDDRIGPLFHRWPRLTAAELRELERLWAERLRVARKLGGLRRRSRRAA